MNPLEMEHLEEIVLYPCPTWPYIKPKGQLKHVWHSNSSIKSIRKLEAGWLVMFGCEYQDGYLSHKHHDSFYEGKISVLWKLQIILFAAEDQASHIESLFSFEWQNIAHVIGVGSRKIERVCCLDDTPDIKLLAVLPSLKALSCVLHPNTVLPAVSSLANLKSTFHCNSVFHPLLTTIWSIIYRIACSL